MNRQPSACKAAALPLRQYPMCDVPTWCGWRDLNPQAFQRCLLRAVRLPIPPHPQGGRGWISTISNRVVSAVLPDIHYPPKSVLSVLMRQAIIKTKVRNRSLADRDSACWWPGLESNQPLRIFSPSLSPFELPGHVGVPEGDRTLDARIKSPVLYQLSYWHIVAARLVYVLLHSISSARLY